MGAMLTELGLTDLQDMFEKEDVTIDLLLDFTNDDLKELGIQTLGQRKTILNAVKQLKSQTGFEKYVIITVLLQIFILAGEPHIYSSVSTSATRDSTRSHKNILKLFP